MDGTHFTQAETEKSKNLFLYIDLPRFDFPVVFTESVCFSMFWRLHSYRL